MSQWNRSSWRKKPIVQNPTYKDEDIEEVEQELKNYPPLVFAGEVRNLKRDFAKAVDGKAFLLQGGDCAESFSNFKTDDIKNTFKAILQMSIVLTYESSKPIIKVGRIAGQFAKPRSSDTEVIDGVELPSYRGDIINDIAFSKGARVHDPKRLLRAYMQSVSTINFLRSLARGGFADLHKVNKWNLDFLKKTKYQKQYKNICDSITKSLSFIEACGISSKNTNAVKETIFYTSHEALLLNYEECLTREDSLSGNFYNCSAHMLWVGDRTRQLNGAHVEYLKGIENPVGIKVGPSIDKDELVKIIDILNPQDENGKINLIVRMGHKNIEKQLPSIIKNIKRSGKKVLWSIDPMHGNTVKSKSGYKTRDFDKITQEVKSFFNIHKQEGTYAGGIHLEMTGENVTECIGGVVKKVSEDNLKDRYLTQCDPRLNADQSLELAFLLSELLKEQSI